MGLSRLDDDFSVGVIGEADPHLVVDAALEFGVGVVEDGDDVFEPGDECLDLGLGEGAVGWLAAELAFEAAAFLLDFGDPVADDRGLGAWFEDLAVASELGLALFEAPAEVELVRGVVVGRVLAGGDELGAGGLDVVVVEEAGEPGVEARGDGLLADLDGPLVLFGGDGILGRGTCTGSRPWRCSTSLASSGRRSRRSSGPESR